MNDPYKILGVSRDATETEIKHAYRELSRKYHPDANVDNPLQDLAAEKFREIQEAYNQIMDERGNKASSFNYGGFGKNYSRSSSSSSEEDSHFMAALNYINARRFQEALNVLNGISNHNARWYYFSAVANMGMGNNAVAVEYAKTATEMEPNNPEYANYYRQVQSGGRMYQNNPYGGTYGRQNSCGTGNICCDLWCADTLCECMGGDLCSCI